MAHPQQFRARWALVEALQQALRVAKIEILAAPVHEGQGGETVILDRFDQFFAQRTDLAGGAEGAVAHVAPGAPGALADLRRRRSAPATAVELLQLGEGPVVQNEGESNAAGEHGAGRCTLSGVEERAMGGVRVRRE